MGAAAAEAVSAEKPVTRLRARWHLEAVAFAVLLRALVGFGLLGAMPLVSDALSYSDFAKDLLASFPGDAAYYWPPGNSLLLAATYAVLGATPAAARLAMLVLSSATVPLVGLCARELSPRAERPALWIAALYPPAVMLVGESYAQHLSALALVALAYAGMRALQGGKLAWFAAAGLALGWGCLTRPSMASETLAMLVAFVIAWRRGGLLRARLAGGAAVAIAVAAACVAPVLAHNARHGGGWTISTNNERNLFLGNNPYTPDYKTSHLGQRPLEDLDPETQVYLRSFYARPDARPAMQHEALSYMASHPGKTLVRSVNRATSFWGFDYLASRLVQEDRGWGTKKLLPLLAIEAGSYVVVLALAIAAMFALRASCDRAWRAWLVGLALAYELPYVIAFSGGTYHFPVVPLLIPFAAVVIAERKGLAARVRASKATWIALVVFALIQVQYAYYSMKMSG